MTSDRTRGTTAVNGPALELNNGVAPNTQLHLIVPYFYLSADGAHASGLGDTEFGVKYRFVSEEGSRPEIGIFPLAELPTGDDSKGLSNGKTFFKLPVWLEKNWGPWMSYGGAGYTVNSAPGQRNYYYGGLLVQRTLCPKLTLGGEMFFQGAQLASDDAVGTVAGARSSGIANFGGSYNFTPDFSLLFTAGRSFQGEGHHVLYLGLYRTWGPGSP